MPPLNGSLSRKKLKKPIKTQAVKRPPSKPSHAKNTLVWEVYYQNECPVYIGKILLNGQVLGDVTVIREEIGPLANSLRMRGIEIVIIDPPYIPDRVKARNLAKKLGARK